MLLEPLLLPVRSKDVSDARSPVVPYLAQHLERLSCTTYLFLNHWIAYWIGRRATFSRQEKRKNLLAKKKRRLLLARLRPLLEMGHSKQSRFITRRIPRRESEIESQGLSRVEHGVACQKAVICQCCDLRQAPPFLCASVSSSVKEGGGGDSAVSHWVGMREKENKIYDKFYKLYKPFHNGLTKWLNLIKQLHLTKIEQCTKYIWR